MDENPWTLRLIVGGIILLAVAYVGFSLQRPEPPTFAPSPVAAEPVGERLVGPRTYTVDAADPEQWVYFSFERGSVVEEPGILNWDLAFRRFNIIVNGGDGYAGGAGLLDLGPVPFDSVHSVPDDGYEGNPARSDASNPVIEEWYDYSFFSHLLMPRGHVYAVRTSDGRHAKLEILSYYCPGALPGCLTFRYVYQGAGGPALVHPLQDRM